MTKYIIKIFGGVQSMPLGPFKEGTDLFLEFCKDIEAGGTYEPDTDCLLLIDIKNEKIISDGTLCPTQDEIDEVVKDIDKVRSTKNKNLPLLIGQMKSEEGKRFLEEKLKGK